MAVFLPDPHTPHPIPHTLLPLLQLSSSALPVGAYSYSEGLETLVDRGIIHNASSLADWMNQELTYGAIRLEAAVMVQAYQCLENSDLEGLSAWNQWISAFRETEELREQSWQMGRSLSRLLLELAPSIAPPIEACGENCNFAIAFILAAHHWQIDRKTALLGYLHSWAMNLINAGIKLIPLGQTAGQKLLLQTYPTLEQTATTALTLPVEEFAACGWGLAIASMTHETLYSRLFRS